MRASLDTPLKNKLYMKRHISRIVVYAKRIWPYIVSLSGALVMGLAFFIPSVQDQFDRFESRKIVDRYVSLGDEFMVEEQYKMAEEAFAKAYELSDQKRLDIEVKRLTAKINRVNVEIEWGAEMPEDLKEIDFQFLIHFLKGKEHHEKDLMAARNCYGVFLAHSHREKEALALFNEILAQHPNEAITLINLGNLYDYQGNKTKAEDLYRRAISAEPGNAWAHYYLAHLLRSENQLQGAKSEFEKVMQLDPSDSDAIMDYRSTVKEIAKGH